MITPIIWQSKVPRANRLDTAPAGCCPWEPLNQWTPSSQTPAGAAVGSLRVLLMHANWPATKHTVKVLAAPRLLSRVDEAAAKLLLGVFPPLAASNRTMLENSARNMKRSVAAPTPTPASAQYARTNLNSPLLTTLSGNTVPSVKIRPRTLSHPPKVCGSAHSALPGALFPPRLNTLLCVVVVSIKANRTCQKCSSTHQTVAARVKHEDVCRGSLTANLTCQHCSIKFSSFGSRIVHEKSCKR